MRESIGAMSLHGPHHVAYTSTSNGERPSAISCRSCSAVTSPTWPGERPPDALKPALAATRPASLAASSCFSRQSAHPTLRAASAPRSSLTFICIASASAAAYAASASPSSSAAAGGGGAGGAGGAGGEEVPPPPEGDCAASDGAPSAGLKCGLEKARALRSSLTSLSLSPSAIAALSAPNASSSCRIASTDMARTAAASASAWATASPKPAAGLEGAAGGAACGGVSRASTSARSRSSRSKHTPRHNTLRSSSSALMAASRISAGAGVLPSSRKPAVRTAAVPVRKGPMVYARGVAAANCNI
mmetsp:Transcript_30114/g.96191  ORF Transcript_30114/g.96191 Transcript_30114/m.96191 type:complete len:303 (+) Transcript_30114:362-1270(+)